MLNLGLELPLTLIAARADWYIGTSAFPGYPFQFDVGGEAGIEYYIKFLFKQDQVADVAV